MDKAHATRVRQHNWLIINQIQCFKFLKICK